MSRPSWKNLFTTRGSSDSGRDTHSEQLLIEPRSLLEAHRSRLNALRLESGYDFERYEGLINAVLLRVAEWVHSLPASRAENHSEMGGLLRLAVETACLSYRRADGKFLARHRATDVRNRERDRVWRYAVLLGGLLRPLGRGVTYVRVVTGLDDIAWNPLQEALWVWHRRVQAQSVVLHWRDGIDARPTFAASTWIAARILQDRALSYLLSGDEGLPELLLQIVSGSCVGPLGEIVGEAHQAAVDQDLAHRSSASGNTPTAILIEHRLLEALRMLCRENWTCNTPGGRLWVTDDGVFLVWKAAASDALIRMRADGLTGVPRDPDTLAEVLVTHGVLTANPTVSTGLKHYYKLLPEVRGVPKQALEVVKVADPELLGLRLEAVERVRGALVSASGTQGASDVSAPSMPRTLDLPLDSRLPESVPSLTPSPVPANSALSDVRAGNGTLDGLRRFGAPGTTLQKLAEHLLCPEGQRLPLVRVASGLALGFPEAIAEFCSDPQDFLVGCEAQGLLVPSKEGSRHFVWTRDADQTHLPKRFVVLVSRVARYLPVPGGDRS